MSRRKNRVLSWQNDYDFSNNVSIILETIFGIFALGKAVKQRWFLFACSPHTSANNLKALKKSSNKPICPCRHSDTVDEKSSKKVFFFFVNENVLELIGWKEMLGNIVWLWDNFWNIETIVYTCKFSVLYHQVLVDGR